MMLVSEFLLKILFIQWGIFCTEVSSLMKSFQRPRITLRVHSTLIISHLNSLFQQAVFWIDYPYFSTAIWNRIIRTQSFNEVGKDEIQCLDEGLWSFEGCLHQITLLLILLRVAQLLSSFNLWNQDLLCK